MPTATSSPANQEYEVGAFLNGKVDDPYSKTQIYAKNEGEISDDFLKKGFRQIWLFQGDLMTSTYAFDL